MGGGGGVRGCVAGGAGVGTGPGISATIGVGRRRSLCGLHRLMGVVAHLVVHVPQANEGLALLNREGAVGRQHGGEGQARSAHHLEKCVARSHRGLVVDALRHDVRAHLQRGVGVILDDLFLGRDHLGGCAVDGAA